MCGGQDGAASAKRWAGRSACSEVTATCARRGGIWISSGDATTSRRSSRRRCCPSAVVRAERLERLERLLWLDETLDRDKKVETVERLGRLDR